MTHFNDLPVHELPVHDLPVHDLPVNDLGGHTKATGHAVGEALVVDLVAYLSALEGENVFQYFFLVSYIPECKNAHYCIIYIYLLVVSVSIAYRMVLIRSP